jgi:hypothetical protein
MSISAAVSGPPRCIAAGVRRLVAVATRKPDSPSQIDVRGAVEVEAA